MSKFHVGQRVRFVRAHPANRRIIGMEGVITHVGSVRTKTERVYPYQVTLTDGGQWGADSTLIEPLTPPKSQQLVSWDEMPCTRSGQYREVVVVESGR